MSEPLTLASHPPTGAEVVSPRRTDTIARAERHPQTDTGTIVIHWIVAIAMVASLITGLRISADAPIARTAKFLAPLLPQGEVWTVHFVAGLSLFFGITAYLVYLVRGRPHRSQRPDAHARDPCRRPDEGGAQGPLGRHQRRAALVDLSRHPHPDRHRRRALSRLSAAGWCGCTPPARWWLSAYIAVHTAGALHVRRRVAAPAAVPSGPAGGRRGAPAPAPPRGRTARHPGRGRPRLGRYRRPLDPGGGQGRGRARPQQSSSTIRSGAPPGPSRFGRCRAPISAAPARRPSRSAPCGTTANVLLRFPLVGPVALAEARPADQEGRRLARPRRRGGAGRRHRPITRTSSR